MLFKIRSQKEILRTEKSSFPLTAFCAVQKRPMEFPRPPFSLGWMALWGHDVIWLLALPAWTQYCCFKTTIFTSWPAEAIAMSIQPYQREPEYSSSEEAEEEPVDSGEEEVS